MTYDVRFMPLADKSIKKWKKSNAQYYKKFEKILVELKAHPRTGLGHPEPLVGGNGTTYSRRISAHDRLIYDIYDDVVTVLVIEVEGHYNDK